MNGRHVMGMLEIDVMELRQKPQLIDRELDATEVQKLLEDVEDLSLASESMPVHLRAEMMGETIRIRGTVSGEFSFDCGRCMRQRPYTMDEEVEFILMPRHRWQELYDEEEELELSEEDMDVSFYEGDDIDVAPLLREALLLELPGVFLCPDSEREACDEALEEYTGGAHGEMKEEAEVDMRWSALRELKAKMADGEGEPGGDED